MNTVLKQAKVLARQYMKDNHPELPKYTQKYYNIAQSYMRNYLKTYKLLTK